MTRYNIRHATSADIDSMLHIFDAARTIMRSDGNLHQWNNGYPSRNDILNDLSREVSYVVEDADGLIVATFAFITTPDPTYSVIVDGQWLDDTTPYGTIHRLASTPDSHGIAQLCFDWCFNSTHNVRVDTHRDNRIMQHVLLQNGFTRCGIIFLANGDEREAFQRIR